MLKKIRVSNIHCLADTGWIDIKPLTFLVGNNSSGKSSFARIFPLIRQSIEHRTKGPMLLYGVNGYVDFGSFQDSVHKSSATQVDCIDFCFSYELEASQLRYSPWYRPVIRRSKTIDLKMTIKDNGDYTFIDSFSITNSDSVVRVSCLPGGPVCEICINDKIESGLGENIWVVTESFFPMLLHISPSEEGVYRNGIQVAFSKKLFEFVKSFSRSN